MSDNNTPNAKTILAEKLIKKLGKKREVFLFKLFLALRPDLSARAAKLSTQEFEHLSEENKAGFIASVMFPTSFQAQRQFDVTLTEVDAASWKAFETKIKLLR